MTQSNTLFAALTAKINYLEQRNTVLATNIANADTPGYRPKDINMPDFSAVLRKTVGGNTVAMTGTSPGHLGFTPEIMPGKNFVAKKTYEVSPTGNAVILEEQARMASETMIDHMLMTNIYQKHVGMMRTAMGRS